MNMIELLQDHNVPMLTEGHGHCREGWVQLECPYCGTSGTHGGWYLGYNLSNNYFNCWRCGPHQARKVVVDLTGLSFREVKSIFQDLDVQQVRREERPRGKLVLPPGLCDLMSFHKRYIKRRGFDVEEVERLWGVRGIGPAGRLAWRLFLPIVYHGETVSWTTRSLLDKGQRYISAGLQEESIPHKSLLYGEDYVRHGIIVHEGPLDVWAVGPGAVATCGTSYTQAQVNRLSRYTVRAVCFDNEPEAQRRARELCDALEVFPGKTFNVVLDAKDAGSAEPKEIRRLRRAFL